MGRQKIDIKLIDGAGNRKVTYLKRSSGLVKKAHELSVLCDIDVAVIMFPPGKGKLTQFCNGRVEDVIARYANSSCLEESRVGSKGDRKRSSLPVLNGRPKRRCTMSSRPTSSCSDSEIVEAYQGIEKADNDNFIEALNACANLGDMEKGEQVHAAIIEAGIVPESDLLSALADMYRKCGLANTVQHNAQATGTPTELVTDLPDMYTQCRTTNVAPGTTTGVLREKVRKLEQDLDMSQRHTRIFSGEDMWGLDRRDLQGIEAQLVMSIEKVRNHKLFLAQSRTELAHATEVPDFQMGECNLASSIGEFDMEAYDGACSFGGI